MERLYQKIGLNLSVSHDLQSKEIVEKFLLTINKYGDTFIPDVYGYSEPLKLKYKPNDISGPANIYMHEEINKKLAMHGQAGGSLMMKKKSGEIFYHIEWGKSTTKPRFNYFGFSVPIRLLKRQENYIKFVAMCNEFAALFKPIQGQITNSSFPNWGEPVELEIRLPEIRWMNYYGKPYIEMFGEEKLMRTPCYKVEKISDGLIAIQATENLFEDIHDEVKATIKKYLGEDAFVWDNKRALSYKDKGGRVPKFDFSGVTFKPE